MCKILKSGAIPIIQVVVILNKLDDQRLKYFSGFGKTLSFYTL